ncbi:MAG: hypothetical protein IT435_18590 [Phycisphaerales bacterium]|nr:hypothetical protein [Phycisphaerales bacterium]
MALIASMDRKKKVTLGVAILGLAVGGVLIVNSATGGAALPAAQPPQAVPLTTEQKAAHDRQHERQQDQVESGQVDINGG